MFLLQLFIQSIKFNDLVMNSIFGTPGKKKKIINEQIS